MAKRCVEEFNPWPAFVDIFSSVILVMLLFLLITIVNIAYYSQFKFKVSYTGTIPADKPILQESKKEIDVKELKQEKKQDINTTTQIKIIYRDRVAGDMESAGKDFRKFYEEEETEQRTVLNEDYLILNFGDSGIKIENPSIISIKKFITKMKSKYPKHRVKINAVDPTNQFSSTMRRQTSLARTFNARSLIRQLKYDIKDVRIDLMNSSKLNIKNENPYGYLIIRVEKK